MLIWSEMGAAVDPAVIERARFGCEHLHEFGRIYPLGRPAAHFFAAWQAELLGQPRNAAAAWRKSLAAAHELAMPYEAAAAHFALSRSAVLPDKERAEHRAEAIRIFSELNAVYDLVGVD